MKWEIVAPFLIYLVAVLGVTYFAGRVMRSSVVRGGSFMAEYFVGGRNDTAWILAFTFLATFASAGTFIGYPGLAYKNGMTVIMTGINQITMVYVAFGVIGKRLAIMGHRTGAVTYTELMLRRFDHPLVLIGVTAAILVFFIAFMIAQFSGAARILQSVGGVPYNFGVMLFAGVVAISVVVGGYRAVAWSDFLQGLVMLLGLLIVFPAFVVLGGGFEKITTTLLSEDPGLVFGPGPKTWLPVSMLLSFWVLWVILGVANPATAVRFLAAKDSRSIHKGLIVGTVAATIFYVPMFYMGAGARTILPGIAPDTAIPGLYVAALPAWVAGIALAAPFAAVMSTVDSLLLVMAGSLVRDVYHVYVNPGASDQKLARLAYVVTAILGLIVLLLALTPPKLLANIVIYFGGGVTAAFVVPLLAALYWPRATTWGAIASIFGGFIGFLLIDIYAKNPLQVMSYVWGLAISLALMVIVSHLTKPSPREVIDLFYGPVLPKPVGAANREDQARAR